MPSFFTVSAKTQPRIFRGISMYRYGALLEKRCIDFGYVVGIPHQRDHRPLRIGNFGFERRASDEIMIEFYIFPPPKFDWRPIEFADVRILEAAVGLAIDSPARLR